MGNQRDQLKNTAVYTCFTDAESGVKRLRDLIKTLNINILII